MRVIVVILLIYLAFRFLVNYILPFVLRSAVQKAARNMQNGPFNNGGYHTGRRREGEVSIEGSGNSKAAPKRRGNFDEAGEYVDFTEIK